MKQMCLALVWISTPSIPANRPKFENPNRRRRMYWSPGFKHMWTMRARNPSTGRWMSVWAHLHDVIFTAVLHRPQRLESCQTPRPLHSVDFRWWGFPYVTLTKTYCSTSTGIWMSNRLCSSCCLGQRERACSQIRWGKAERVSHCV